MIRYDFSYVSSPAFSQINKARQDAYAMRDEKQDAYHEIALSRAATLAGTASLGIWGAICLAYENGLEGAAALAGSALLGAVTYRLNRETRKRRTERDDAQEKLETIIRTYTDALPAQHIKMLEHHQRKP